MKLVFFIIFTGIFSFYFALIVSKNKDRMKQKYVTYYKLMIRWIEIIMQGKCLDKYLNKRGITNVAVYGNGDMGKLLIKYLLKTNITVNYLIDKCPTPTDGNCVSVYRPTDKLPSVDAIIVTPVCDYENIKSLVSKQVNCMIISLYDILEGMDNE